MYFVIFATVLIIYEKDITKPVFLLGIPMVLICFFIIERYVYHAFFYVLLHGIFIIPVILVPFPTRTYMVLYIILLIGEYFHAESVWKHNTEKTYSTAPWEFYLFMVLIYITAKAYHYENLVNILFYCGILLLLLHFIQFYIEGIHIHLTKSQNATSVPAGKIIVSSSMMIGFVLIVFCISCLCTKGMNLDAYIYSFGKWLGELFVAVIKWLLYIATLIHAYFARNRKTEVLKDRQQDYENTFSELWENMSASSLLAKIIYGSLSIVVYGIIIYFLYQGVKQLYDIYIKRYAKDDDVITFISPPKEVKQTIKNNTPLPDRIKNAFQWDNRKKLRYIYRLLIHRHKEYIHRKSNTPRDIAIKINELYDKDISELTGLYEKARYSNEIITNEDVQKGGTL